MYISGVPLGELLFVRFDGSPLPPLQNYPGSLMRQFEDVSGIKDFCFTKLRKALEGRIQASDKLVQFSNDLNSHNARVGKAFYDNMGSARR